MREKLAFANAEEKIEMLNLLVAFEFVHEAFIISTCNRVEIVIATRDNFSSFHAILGLMAQKSDLNFYELKTTAVRYDDEEAVGHIFSVVSSLDSLVVGESQITGQVKEAFMLSHKNKTAGRKLNRLISYAVKCAAQVRNATNISQNPISIASVAVAQAHKILGDNMAGMTGVVLGAGEMGVLAAKHLLRAGCDVVMLGRDLEKVERVAHTLGENVKADTVDKLEKYINRYRLLFSATSAKEPVVTKEMIENESINRLWFDMAIPRDIEDMEMEKLQLFRIDDLRAISQSNHALRQEQALKATEVVQSYLDEFYQWLQALTVEPVIKQMRLAIEEVIAQEVARSISKGYLPEQYSSNAKRMITQVFDKYLHGPTSNLRRLAKGSDGQKSVNAFKEIFSINTDGTDFSKYKTTQTPNNTNQGQQS